MTREINYLLSGKPHLPYLLTSLYTLRNHWDGPVVISAWEESFEMVEAMVEKLDPRGSNAVPMEIHVVKREPVWRGRNDQFMDKIHMVMGSEADTVLYLDADTTTHGDLSPLFEHAERSGFCATQFCGWTMDGLARSRVEKLRPFPVIPQEHIDHLLQAPTWPSVNGGIWAAKPSSPVLPEWYNWTDAAKKDVFIADEAVLHVCSSVFVPLGEMSILCGGHFNCSPMRYQPKDLPDEHVRVWHYHGDCNTRRNKCPKGYDLWWPIWQECLDKNIGGCAEWQSSEVGNKWMRQLPGSFRA